MKNTYQILINWDKGQPFAERMSAKLITIEDYSSIDPQLPAGGPDGGKDIICCKGADVYVVGCYFPNGQKDFNAIKDKFDNDILGVAKNSANGFIFITNQKITPSERITLGNGHNFSIDIIHGERVCNLLDSPKGYGIRLEYLGISLSQEEQISFLNSYVNLKSDYAEIKSALDDLKQVTNALGQMHLRDRQTSSLSVLPIAGVNFASRLSIEDLLALHRTVLQEEGHDRLRSLSGFRKVEVWIGKPGSEKDLAKFVPPPPGEVVRLVHELLYWWRDEYSKKFYDSDEEKIKIIALFHERFLTIHPFIDGNGRVARVLASLQFKDLLDKDVEFEAVDRSEYYDALQSAISGNKQELTRIFTLLIT